MNWRKTAATAILAVVVLVGLVGCPKKPPATPPAPVGPDTTWVGMPTVYQCSTSASGSIKYIMDWGDTKVDTTSRAYESNEKASISHVWATAGDYNVKVTAILDADNSKASDASPAKKVTVLPNEAPVIDTLIGPSYTATGALARFTAIAHDPDGDSLTLTFNFAGSDTTTGLFASPCTVSVTHVFTDIETVEVSVYGTDAKQTKGTEESITVRVGPAGAVMDFWRNNDEDEASLITSLVLVSDGSEDCVWGACEDDYTFYGIKISNMHTTATGSTAYPEYVFTGHPAYCTQTAHFIVGSEEGELYALEMGTLSKKWRYPEKSPEESITGIEWGAPAINGNRLYVPHGSDSIFYFTDNGDAVARMNAYAIHASVVDAPIIDAQGNVLFGTDSGYLYKLDANVNYVWRTPLQGNGEIHGPVLDADGTIYCTSDSSRVYAINPADGSVKWMKTTNGEGIRPVVGTDGIYLGTSTGRFYKFDKATGTALWGVWLGSSEFGTSPILAGTDYIYAQNDLDVLYCVQRSDGAIIWACDCPSYLPRTGRARTMQLTDYAPNPTIAADGNIIVVGSDAVYKVKGYSERILDASAPWPKWQRNLLNTGK